MINLDDFTEESFRVDRKVKSIIEFMETQRCSIRQVSENLQIPKSTVHLYIHTYIKHYYDYDYQIILKILEYNCRYRRMPRKYWRSGGKL